MDPKPKVSTARKIYRISIVVTLIYSLTGIALYHLQENILFHPQSLQKDFQFRFTTPFKEVNIPMSKSDTVNLVQFLSKDSIPKGVVIYFHGNTGNVIHYANHVTDFTKNGFEVWMPDYPSFGKTTGKLTEENIYYQAKEVYKLAHSKFATDRIILYGKSLGSGVAAYIAAKEDCADLILETPYYSIPDLFSYYAPVYPTKRMSHFKFPVDEYLKDIKEPIFIFHGTSDQTIPYREAVKLKENLKPGDEFITIENGKHNNLTSFSLYRKKLDSILKR